MYQPSRTVTTFYVAGMSYWDGVEALGSMTPGDHLRLVAEPDNPHDANAVALYFDDIKLGYIPRDNNELAALLLAYGHEDVLEARVLSVDLREKPWHQVFVALLVTNGRKGRDAQE